MIQLDNHHSDRKKKMYPGCLARAVIVMFYSVVANQRQGVCARRKVDKTFAWVRTHQGIDVRDSNHVVGRTLTIIFPRNHVNERNYKRVVSPERIN